MSNILTFHLLNWVKLKIAYSISKNVMNEVWSENVVNSHSKLLTEV